MEDAALLDKLSDLTDTDYGRIYFEWGGFRTSRSISHVEGEGWMFNDAAHGSYNFHCVSLREALGYMLEPPCEQEWDENIVKFYGEPNPGVLYPRGST